MAETNNLKKVFKNLSAGKVLNIASIALSVVAIIISIVAINKAPNKGFKGKDFVSQRQVWEKHDTNQWRDDFVQKNNRDNSSQQNNGFNRMPNKNAQNRDKFQNQNGQINDNKRNSDRDNTKGDFDNDDPKIERFRQNNTY